jgi:hypothetical protein
MSASSGSGGGGGGGGSNINAAPTPADLTALMEEKNRLMRRLQAKQAQAQASAALAAPKPSVTRAESTREAGFSTYINGANEERVTEQRKREKASAAAALKRGESHCTTRGRTQCSSINISR